ncbi:DUF4198 domain-containing protein [Caulobacter segnis]
MTFKKRLLAVAALGVVLALPMTASAHRGWIVPSATVLSGDVWVTFDAAISNELFYPDHNAMRLDGLVVTAPDGTVDKLQNGSTGKYRSTFDVALSKPGTWKIGSSSQSVTASYTEAGAVKRFRGSPEDFAKQVPAGAADLKTIKSFNRNEVFVTRDKPTTDVFKPTGKGLELVPVTHPNDLVAGEAASFKFLVDGKPAADLEVTIAEGGSRYSPRADQKVKTGADGVLKFTLPEAGMYWINASVRSGATAGRGLGGPGGPGGGMGGPGGAPGSAPGSAPGAAPAAAQPLAGDGYSAGYTAVIEAQRP